MKLVSWHTVGLRGLSTLIEQVGEPDILCLQGAAAEHFPLASRYPAGYQVTWVAGDGGLALYTRTAPESLQIGLGLPRFDSEGRAIIAHYDSFILLNVCLPSGAGGRSAWFYKMAFHHHLLDVIALLRTNENGLPIILCGDFALAHQDIDLARPIRVAGFTAEERDWVSELLESGFIDSYRARHPNQEGAYTWWPHDLREQNRGWRVDYIFVDKMLSDALISANIHPDISGADHCPISITW